MKPSIWAIGFLLLFLAGFGLRAALVSLGPYHSDTLAYANCVKASVDQKRVVGLHGHGYPLTAILGAGFYQWTASWWGGDPVRAVNAFNVILSSAAFLPFFYIAAALLSRPGAAAASLLFLVNPLLLSVSEYGNSHAPALLFSLLSLCFLLSYQKSGRGGLFFLSGLFFGLAGAARIQDAVVLIVPWTYCFFAFPQAACCGTLPGAPGCKTAGRYLSGAGLAFGVILGFYGLLKTGRAAPIDARLLAFNIVEPYRDMASLYHLRLSLGYLVDIFSIPGLLAAALGLGSLFRSRRPLAIFLTLWFGVPFLLLGNHFMVTPRWLVPALIPVLLAEGELFARMFASAVRPVRLAAALLLVGLLTVSLARIIPVLWFRHIRALTPDYARWVGAVTEPDAVIVVGDDGPFISRYGNRQTLRQIVTDTTYFQKADTLRKELKDYKDRLTGYLNAGTPVYVTEIGLKSSNQGVFYFFMTKYFRVKYVGEAPFEVWHRSCLRQKILTIKLYKIERRNPPKKEKTNEDSADSQP